ncbi:run domain Beclin-1-interacting and cysteine-rich domain-containing protein [Eurytemora carolleeae]|uniref:run domain Beclin-1-interacting and cysteine-rich domain-containing protein n=1 Tax=Eurytemora carolleeae TaxID=1294199 RepID=UPI000C7679ED|nr:run domain Beclin-1-interacting and cysteine-rich domain-containing protein [Eurytemora carolleeae]|eukprot:XP_023337964.1 run domain Beclin-1-interacting and cysteine-rich domain-containing protein-like [Eurytemora affinis]
MKRIDEQEESDDEIRDLKEKLRMRREEIYSSRSRKTKPRKPGRKISRRMPGMILSDGKTDPGTTDQSGSTDYNSEDSYEFEKMLDSNDEDYSKFERGSKDFVGSLSNIPEGSAESIALSLLGQIGAGRLPPADQLPWLVSEEDAPQQLLPLPDSLPVDPEDDLKGATALRGNLLWAPPRPQLVLTVQYKPKNRKAAMYLQKWQCSGCGMKVEQKYSKSYRFCNYLGKFFCTGCHENTGAIIPARVIQDWDFKRYPVSNFSLDILNSMHTEPVFNIQDLNPDIIRKIEKLRAVCMSRLQMNKLSRYISTCKHAVHLQSRIEEFLCPDPYLFSMEQLVCTRFNKLGYTIRAFVGELLKHVQECDLCQAKGFICEGCRSGASIFPFQFGVHECTSCYACYHSNCYSTEYGCTRCKRLQIRQALEPVVC